VSPDCQSNFLVVSCFALRWNFAETRTKNFRAGKMFVAC
jgi:hypothetical protein